MPSCLPDPLSGQLLAKFGRWDHLHAAAVVEVVMMMMMTTPTQHRSGEGALNSLIKVILEVGSEQTHILELSRTTLPQPIAVVERSPHALRFGARERHKYGRAGCGPKRADNFEKCDSCKRCVNKGAENCSYG